MRASQQHMAHNAEINVRSMQAGLLQSYESNRGVHDDSSAMTDDKPTAEQPIAQELLPDATPMELGNDNCMNCAPDHKVG